MLNDTTQSKLLHNLFTLLRAHRPAFKQERPFLRAVGMVLGEIFSFGRHTVTQGMLSLGITDGDWSAWYRLFSRERFDEEKLSECLLQETLAHVGAEEPYCAAIDSTSIHRSSLKMPGTRRPFFSFSTGHSSCPAFSARCLVDTPGSGVQPGDPAAFSTRFSSQGDPGRCASSAGMGSGP